MNEEQWAKGRDLLARIIAIGQARKRWDRHPEQKALVSLLGLDEDAGFYIDPAKVLETPLVAQFRRAVLEQMDAEERRLRQEFEKL